MGDDIIRHIIAAVATIIVLVAYYSGYVSGQYGWWWTAFGALIIYGGIYKIINKD